MSKKVESASQDTRSVLVETAASIFNDVGYFGTDTNRIARAAGFSPATFYRYFTDKRAIFIEAYRQWVLAEWDALQKEQGRESEEPSERARRVVDVVVEHHRRWATFRRNLLALVTTDEAVREVWLRQRAAQMKALRALVPDQGRLDDDQVGWVLLCCERIADALATDEARQLGLSADGLTERLVGLAGGSTDYLARR